MYRTTTYLLQAGPSRMTRQSRTRSRMPILPSRQLDHQHFRLLADFRYLIRRFLKFSEDAADGLGLTARQHQALLVIKACPYDGGPSVGDLAEQLCIQHHSAVELVDRLVEARLIIRSHDIQDRRLVKLSLTDEAEGCLSRLSEIHLEELRRLRPMLGKILDQVDESSAET